MSVMVNKIGEPIEQARAFLAKPKKLLINNQWVDATSGETIESRDPATEAVISHIPAGNARDVEAAVAAARAAFESGPWHTMLPKQRAQLLWRLSDMFESRIEEFAALETFDNGAPLALTRHMMQTGIDALRYYAGMATKIYGQTSEISNEMGDFHAYTRAEAVGVVGIITPWNAPLTVVCNKIAPALAAGCTCIVKPAELTSLTTLRFGELILEAGFPAGVVNIVTGLGTVAGAAMGTHLGIDKISFTGSTAVGRRLVEAAAGDFKRLTLELGGKSPLIIMDDADLSLAIPGAAMAIFGNSGQVCFAGSRLYIHDKIYDAVVAGLAQAGSALKLGNGFDPDTHLGPLISGPQRDKVMNYIDLGTREGGEIVVGGQRHGEQGYFVQPTVFANTKPDARIASEEIFGPVLVANRFTNVDDMVTLANATRYGLGSGIFTQHLSTAHGIAKRLRAGNVWINCYGVLDASMPFGGFKESGWGREFGPEGIEPFLEKKAVYARL
jgi:acyl-CoA reductase-like NAD-dependent aldehyde dehydrogenase